MKVQILSDLHLDNGTKSFDDVLSPVGDVLCLLGDVGSPMNSMYSAFIDHCALNFQQVSLRRHAVGDLVQISSVQLVQYGNYSTARERTILTRFHVRCATDFACLST
jgi:hypothetical protein